MPSRLIRVTALAMLAFCAQRVSAQQQPASIPTALAASMLSAFGGPMELGAPRFVVGRPPEKWPSSLLPAAPLKLIGGVSFGPLTQIVVVDRSASSTSASLQAMIERAGYRSRDALLRNQGGFAVRSVDSRSYCGNGGTVMVTSIDVERFPHTFAVTVMPDRNAGSRCDDPPGMNASTGEPQLSLPPLLAPDGVTVEVHGTSFSGDRFEATASADSTMSADRLLAHYSAELARGGWHLVGSPLSSGNTAIRELTMTTDKGVAWRGALIILPDAGQREITITMRPAK